MYRLGLYRFMAFTLEGKGYATGDIATIYGITQKFYPAQYEELREALETNNPSIIQDKIETIYDGIYQHSIAMKFDAFYPLNWNMFDMAFNAGEKDAVVCYQRTINFFAGNVLTDDGAWGAQTEASLPLLAKTIRTVGVDKVNTIYGYARQRRYAQISRPEWVQGLMTRVINLQEFIIHIGTGLVSASN